VSLGHWVTESLGHWVTGSLGHWVTGSLGHWVTGSLGHWVTGSLGHGSLGHWVTGSLGHWPTLVPNATCCMFSGSLRILKASSKRDTLTLDLCTLLFGATLPGPYAKAWELA
jgi:hypothetical protein